jgi:hypothetical protein
MRVLSDDIFSGQTVSNTTVNSEPVLLEHMMGYAIWATWSGTTIAGTIKLQATVDLENWEDVANSSVTITGADTNLWNITEAFYQAVRVVVTADDANTITVTAKIYAKGV